MSLFSCFNPAYLRGFSARGGMLNHMQQNDMCAEYATAIVLHTSSDSTKNQLSIFPFMFTQSPIHSTIYIYIYICIYISGGYSYDQ